MKSKTNNQIKNNLFLAILSLSIFISYISLEMLYDHQNFNFKWWHLFVIIPIGIIALWFKNYKRNSK